MIDLTGCVSIPYFKKAVFTGSYGKMRYLLQKAEDEQGNTVLKAVHWHGPYASFKVPEDEKISADFPFDKEGISQAAAWLNEESRNYQIV